jgi:hypothetical protein
MSLRTRVIAQAKKTASLRHRLIVNRKAGKHPRKLSRAYHRAKAELVKRRAALASARDPRAKVVKYAASFIGTKEHPAGTNTGPRIDGWQRNFGIHAEPWCGAFVGSMLLHVGVHVSSRIVYVPSIVTDAKNGVNNFRGWTTDPKRAQPGDVVTLFGEEHTELVRKITATGVHTIGGNTSFDNAGSQSNGGCVAPKFRSFNQIDGFALVRFPN